MNMPPRRGGVFMINDEAIRLPPETRRTRHDHRYVIIISGDGPNADHQWPVVLVIPTSGSGLPTEYDVELQKGMGNLPRRSVARVTLVQPLDKADLKHHCGKLDAAEVDLLLQNLIAYVGEAD